MAKVWRLGELFCGAGGLALGAQNAHSLAGDTIAHTWATDYDVSACSTYLNNIHQATNDSVICADVRNLLWDQLAPIDGFAYGFPCNDFSIVGEQRGLTGEFGGLYHYGIEVIDHFLPSFFVAENVSGLSSANDGLALQLILQRLRAAGNGYDLTVHHYKSELYGVPQTRHRLIIVGFATHLGLRYRIPAPTTPVPISAREALETPPIAPDVGNQELTKQSKLVIERLQHIPPGENIWSVELPLHLQLNVKGAKMSQIYRRLHPDQPSYTITASGGGGTHGYHWREPRALTNRERARLQTFPDDFTFLGTKEDVRRQIGMAVPPKLAQIVFTSILQTLNDEPYPSIPPNYSIPDSFAIPLLRL